MVASDICFFLGGCGRKDVLCACIYLYMIVGLASANVVLIGRNVSLSFADMEANFAPPIKGSGESGMLYVAEPLDACTSLTSTDTGSSNSQFLLTIRGGCTFEDKVRNAQHAGYEAVIVYDYDYDGTLISMSGNSVGIHIHAVFVSRASGEILKKYAGHNDVEFWIIPTFENSVWSIMAISFILLLAMAAVLATCFFVRRHRIRREQPGTPNIRQFHGMSSQLVKAMPSLIFTSVLEDNSTSATCAICLEDYSVGEKLRILPCRHKFHAFCVDSWLTSWRTFCPICKQDAMTAIANPPASERTPLLSSVAASPSSSTRLASFHSSVAGSPPIQIAHLSLWSQSNARLSSAAASPSDAALASFHSSVAASPPIRIAPIPPRSQSNSRLYSLANTSRIPNSNRPYTQSPAINISRSSVDLRNASSQRSRSYLVSPGSMGFQVSSPINSRYGSPYVPSLGNGSPSYLAASSSRQSFLRHCSGASLSALASDHSLPGC